MGIGETSLFGDIENESNVEEINIYEVYKSVLDSETQEQIRDILNQLNNEQLKELIMLLMSNINNIYLENMLENYNSECCIPVKKVKRNENDKLQAWLDGLSNN